MKLLPTLLKLLIIPLVAGQCNEIRQRKEIRELTENEFNAFAKAIKSLHVRKSANELTTYEKLSKKHNELAFTPRAIHFTPEFLPWHRRFLREYEDELRKYSPNIVVPYWDFTLDFIEPHKSPVFTKEYFGTVGKLTDKFVLRDGFFNSTELRYPFKHLLTRSFELGPYQAPYPGPIEMCAIKNEAIYSKFALLMEQVHNLIHYKVGSIVSDFAYYHSPNDPIFFMYHAFLDLLWSKWQEQYPNSPYEGKFWLKPAKPTDKLAGYDETVQSTFNLKAKNYCYSYPKWPRIIESKRASTKTNPLVKTFLASNLFSKIGNKMNYEDLVSLISSNPPNLLEPLDLPKLTQIPQSWLETRNVSVNNMRDFEKKQSTIWKFFRKD